MKIVRLVLVVVPDIDLGRSVAFALEAEGLTIRRHDVLASAIADCVDGPVGCAVVDEEAIEEGPAGWALLASLASPVVLLINHQGSIPEPYAKGAVLKPILGQRLVDAVHLALAGH